MKIKNPSVYFLLSLALSSLYFVEAVILKVVPNHVDVIQYFYPIMNLIRERYLSGSLPLWNEYVFSGFPLMASSQSASLYPVTLAPLLLMPVDRALIFDIIIHGALSCSFAYLYARKIGAARLPAMAAGAVFAFLGYKITFLGHMSVFRAATWIPLIMFGLESIRSEPSKRNTAITAFAVALQFYSGHPQICFYTYMLAIFFVAFQFFHSERSTRASFLVSCLGGMALGLVIAAPQLVASLELSSLSVRQVIDYEVFSRNSVHYMDLLAYVFPGSVKGNAWGYMGLLPLFLAIPTAIFEWKSSVHVRFWTISAGMSLIFALGGSVPLLHKLLYHIPVYNSFRGQDRFLLVYGLAVSVLFALGATEFSKQKALEGNARRILITALIMSSLVFLTNLVLYAMARGTTSKAPLILASLTFLLLVLYLLRRRYGWLRFALVFLIILEIGSFKNIQWIETSRLINYRQELFSYLIEHPGRTAFFTADRGDSLASINGVSDILGYDSLLTSDYNRFLELLGIGKQSAIWQGLIYNNAVLSMLNVRHIVVPDWYQPPGEVQPAYKSIMSGEGFVLFENLLALPRAYSIEHLQVIEDLEGVKKALLSNSLRPSIDAAVSGSTLDDIGTDSFESGRAVITQAAHDRIVISSDFPATGFVVLADQYYPGWEATLDGNKTTVHKVNSILRGVVVPAGKHELVFAYRPWNIYGAFLIGICGAAAALVLLPRKNATRIQNN